MSPELVFAKLILVVPTKRIYCKCSKAFDSLEVIENQYLFQKQ